MYRVVFNESQSNNFVLVEPVTLDIDEIVKFVLVKSAIVNCGTAGLLIKVVRPAV
jgi:hypothetical protein